MWVLMVTHVGAAPGPSEATDSLVDELLTGHVEREAGELRWHRHLDGGWLGPPTRVPQAVMGCRGALRSPGYRLGQLSVCFTSGGRSIRWSFPLIYNCSS